MARKWTLKMLKWATSLVHNEKFSTAYSRMSGKWAHKRSTRTRLLCAGIDESHANDAVKIVKNDYHHECMSNPHGNSNIKLLASVGKCGKVILSTSLKITFDKMSNEQSSEGKNCKNIHNMNENPFSYWLALHNTGMLGIRDWSRWWLSINVQPWSYVPIFAAGSISIHHK